MSDLLCQVAFFVQSRTPSTLLSNKRRPFAHLITLVRFLNVGKYGVIRPQQKRQKKVQEAREALKKGDHVVTVGGIHGKISEVQDTTFIIEVDEGVKLKVEKAAIAIDENGANKK